MLQIPLWDGSCLILSPRWAGLEQPWQIGLLTVLGIGPVCLVLWLYRSELRLVHRGTALGLLGLRLLLLMLLWLLIGMQPVIAHDTVQELPGRVLIAVDRSASMDVADPQRTVPDKLRLARALRLGEGRDPDEEKALCRQIDLLTRTEVARRLLGADGMGLLPALAGRHDVELLGFHEDKWSVKPDHLDKLFNPAAQISKKSGGTNLTHPMSWALQPADADRGPVLSMILLSDGQHNRGGSPLGPAEKLGQRNIPIFPVPMGAREAPPGIVLMEVRAPTNVFKDTEATVEARFKVTGLAAQPIQVELHRPGQALAEEDVRTVQHNGKDRTYSVQFQAMMSQIGTQALEVRVRPAKGKVQEITTANNQRSVLVRVSNDRARVLLVDGEARWEFHYLANALRRDKTVSLDSVLFEQPRLGLVPEAELEQSGNPHLTLPTLRDKDGDPFWRYDCIMLGDVSEAQLPLPDRRRLERYVADGGGTLIVLAGPRHMPLGFVHPRQRKDEPDPLLKVLPVEGLHAFRSEAGFLVNLTVEGTGTPYMQVESDQQANVRRWGKLPHHYWAAIGTAKPGATALAFVADRDAATAPDSPPRDRTLIAFHSYGFGRVLYVGLGSTWRWRFQVGDQYHHRFWGQVVRWAASDRQLPAGNKYVRFGSRQPAYQAGKDVEVVARLEDAAGPIPAGAQASARILRQEPKGKEKGVAEVQLTSAPGQPRLLQGNVRDLPEGSYRIALEIPALGEKLKAPPEKGEDGPRGDTFSVLPVENRELFDLSTNWALLEALATRSGGQVVLPEEAERLLDLLENRVLRQEQRKTHKPWKDTPMVWWLLGVLLGLLTLEWGGRKLAGLP
jgi:hypothetical protein